MAQTRLRVDLSAGTIEAEGDEAFVLQVYNDFKDRFEDTSLRQTNDSRPHAPHKEGDGEAEPPKRKAAASGSRKGRSSTSTRATSTGSGGSLKGYKFNWDPNLDTSGLAEFYENFKPTNNEDRIAIFVSFLEERGIRPATFDQICSCFRELNLKMPEAVSQAFFNARGKKGLIQFSGIEDVTLTVRGSNRVNVGSELRKASE